MKEEKKLAEKSVTNTKGNTKSTELAQESAKQISSSKKKKRQFKKSANGSSEVEEFWIESYFNVLSKISNF